LSKAMACALVKNRSFMLNTSMRAAWVKLMKKRYIETAVLVQLKPQNFTQALGLPHVLHHHEVGLKQDRKSQKCQEP